MRFSNHDYAEFYDRQQREAGYPGALLNPVINELEECLQVIDIGAGTGFFTIPLAEAGHSVTVVEPSREMSDVLLKKCRPETAGRISVINQKWENWDGNMHDASICIHSIYPMSDPAKAISSMISHSKKRMIIVREPSGMKTLSGTVRSLLGIKLNRDFNEVIKSALKISGTGYRLINIKEARNHTIADIESEAESVIYQLTLDASFKTKISDIISSLCEIKSGNLLFKAFYSDNIYIF